MTSRGRGDTGDCASPLEIAENLIKIRDKSHTFLAELGVIFSNPLGLTVHPDASTWHAAMDHRIKSLQDMSTFIECDLPSGKKPLTLK